MFLKNVKKVVTNSSSCDFKPPFVGSSIEAPLLSSTGASLTVKSLTPCVPGSGSLAVSASSSIAALHPCESGVGHGMSSHVSSLRRLKGVQLCECLFLVLRMVLVDP